MRSLRQFWILCLEELRDILCRRRALFALLGFVIVNAAAILALAWVETRVRGIAARYPHDASLAQMLGDIFKQLGQAGFGREANVVRKLLDLPGAVILLHIWGLVWFPTLVALISCDMISSDIYRGSIRYLLVRTTRGVFFFAKFFAHLILYLILDVLSFAALLGTCYFTAADFSFNYYAKTAGLYGLVFLPFLVFLVASAQFVSSFVRRPGRAIMLLHTFWFGLVVLAFVSPWVSPFNLTATFGLVGPFDGFDREAQLTFGLWSLALICVSYLFLRRRPV